MTWSFSIWTCWESALDKLSKEGFHHSRQSVRIIEILEKNGQGLNLNYEVIDGIKGIQNLKENF